VPAMPMKHPGCLPQNRTNLGINRRLLPSSGFGRGSACDGRVYCFSLGVPYPGRRGDFTSVADVGFRPSGCLAAIVSICFSFHRTSFMEAPISQDRNVRKGGRRP
jgi:hypothetical protein